MKKVWQSGLSRSLAVFFLLFFYSNSSWAAHIGALEYNMTIGFEVGKNTLSGEADFDLPAGYGLELTVAGLADLSLRVNGARLEAEPDKKGVLFIPTGDNKRKIFLSWKKKVEEDDCSLLSPEGITLLDTWYPRPSVDAEYQLTALVPKQFSAVSEADRIVIEQKGEQKLVTFHFPHPVSRIHFIAGPYKVVEEEFGDGKILASYFFEEDRELAAGFRQKTHQYLARYIRLFGAYPYGRFAIVENRRPTGFAMPTFTLLGQRVVHLPFIIDSSLGHEVLHSWLGNALRSDPQQGNWVEGLTTYLADHAYAAEKGEGSDFRKNQLVKYQNYLADNSTFTVQGFTSAGSHALADKAVRAVGYNKCAMIFHMLHRRVGEDDFREALRLFYQNNRYGRAGWQEIEETFSAVSGLDLSSFFEQWLTRSDVPVLGIKNLDFRETGGDPFLSFDIVQENSKPYDLVVPVRIDTEAGTVNRSVKMEEGRVSVSLELPGYPVQLVVDGHYDLMRSLVDGELPPVWSAFLGARNKLAVIEEGTKEIYAPMIEMIRGIGGRVIEDKELNAGEMEDNSLLFLGEDSDACRSVFGKVDLPGKGFSLEARKNPLNFEEVAVIVQAADRQEVQAVAEKLRHYGKYGRLYFREGRNIKKAIPESDKGIVRNLDKKPTGIALSKRRDFDDLMEKMAENRVIYVGETHVRPVDHQLQMRIVRALYERHPEMAVGMEMFPASVQETLDRYIRAETGEREFLKEVDYFQNWGYDYRYYQDIMQFARKYGIPVLGLNLEKKIVSDAFRRGGIASLDEKTRNDLTQNRDLSMEGYRERLEEVFKQHQGPYFGNGKLSGFVQAQALWDETMAETIALYLKENPAKKMVVLAGSGHVNKETGIPPRVNRRLEIAQVVAVNARGGEKLDKSCGDYLFFTPPFSMEESPVLGVKLLSREDELVITGFAHGRSAAREAGLKEKDVILALDGQEVTDLEDVKIALLYKDKGDILTVKVRRPVFLFPDSEKEIEVAL